ncbi:hypothetical protein GB928_008560 [Shinella curvata]|uniref:Uncharacterized protein n=1 Tax=Shinella curvata TaxID=1817964 RepID=A0ABT8XBW1_9HYPH|nr:hypothetical protein [Shinella curvata]MCJ8054206.1 hypothetical protein [Shinella curvata]MDO6121228.1 hypothetical protein [Shinella curvata]
MAITAEAFDSPLLDRAVHPLGLLNPLYLADHIEAHQPVINGFAPLGLLGELVTIAVKMV